MRIGTLALVLLPWMVAPRAIAQPMDDQAAEEDQYDDAAPGEPVDNVDVFYDRLADDGTWVDEPDIGHVFIPQQENFVPYHTGYWKNTSVGFVWVSNEPHAWATTHYGRWAYSRPYSRWVWLPDTTWGPSWVDWRTSGDHLGWAPLAPEFVIRTGYVTPVEYWHYAPGNRILDVHINTYYVPRERVVTFHRSAVVMEHYRTIGGARVVVGPPAVRLRSYGYTPAQYRPVKIETRLAGRMTAVEYRGAVQRAHERHDMVETRNRQRIEANPHYNQVHTQAAAKWNNSGAVRPGTPAYHSPGRVEPVRPGTPGHTEPVRPGYGNPGHVEPVHPGTPGHTEPVRPGYGNPGHVEPVHPGTPGHTEPVRPGYPGKVEPPPTHQQPGYGGPTHQAPPPTNPGHTAPPGPTYGGPTHQAPPPTNPGHTAPPGPTYGGPTHQAPPPTNPGHTAPPGPTYGGPTHQAPPPTHTGGSTQTGGGAHQAPPPSRPPPARTPPSKDPKKK
jgi:hypothetical protein